MMFTLAWFYDFMILCYSCACTSLADVWRFCFYSIDWQRPEKSFGIANRLKKTCSLSFKFVLVFEKSRCKLKILELMKMKFDHYSRIFFIENIASFKNVFHSRKINIYIALYPRAMPVLQTTSFLTPSGYRVSMSTQFPENRLLRWMYIFSSQG